MANRQLAAILVCLLGIFLAAYGQFCTTANIYAAFGARGHRAQHTAVWVAEVSGPVVAAVTLTFAEQPYSEIATENELESGCSPFVLQFRAAGLGAPFVRQVIEHAQSLPVIRAISITRATFMERAHVLSTNAGASGRFRPVTGTWRARTSMSGHFGGS